MVKTTDDEPETSREALIPNLKLRTTETEIISFDAIGNFKCSRCGWTHTLAECAEYRLVLANKELEKVNRFVYTASVVEAIKGETTVDTLLRGYRKLLHSEQTDAAKMMKEE